jgi:hypothetical protein
MTTKQLIVFYSVFLGVIVFMGILAQGFLGKPMSAEQYANKFCQELYGPQTAAHWSGDRMMCITRRGEILPAKRPE